MRVGGLKIGDGGDDDGQNGHQQNSRLRFPTVGGEEVIAQLERHWDGSDKVIVKTILEIED
jgi:hypothetical protein